MREEAAVTDITETEETAATHKTLLAVQILMMDRKYGENDFFTRLHLMTFKTTILLCIVCISVLNGEGRKF